MSACETCWDRAYVRSRTLGGTQVEHYQALLREAADHATPETAEECEESK